MQNQWWQESFCLNSRTQIAGMELVGWMVGETRLRPPLATLAEIARGWISDKLLAGGKLAPLALKMVDRTVE
jgi:hypothetical protein